jgi:hypothetical protein
MARHYHENCAYCGTPFSNPTQAGVNAAAASHEAGCSDNPGNAPSADEALENARKELGDW